MDSSKTAPWNNESRTLSDYLRSETRTFTQFAFCSVDSLVLCSLAYLSFEAYPFEDVGAARPIALIDVLRFSPYDKLTATGWMKVGDDVPRFLDAVARCPRFKDLSVSLYANETTPNIDKQFSAVAFTGGDMPPYLAFRGTDGTLAGWKEDFDLAYKDVIPSHISALSYLSGALSCLPSGCKINIGGHSKGGNLAEYAAAAIDDAGFGRLAAVYNHDGPGFLNPPSPRYLTEKYRSIRDKTIPESSVFGMILEKSDDHRIVRSTASTVFQHRPLTWIIDGSDFAYQDELNKSAKLFDTSLDAWLRSCSPEQREVFLNFIFDLVKSTNATTWDEFQATVVQNLPTLFKETRNLDDETKEIILETVRRAGEQFGTNAKGYLSGRMSAMLTKIPKRGLDEQDQ